MDYKNKWKIIEKGSIGEGGQGKVYRVVKLDSNKHTQKVLTDSLKELTSSVIYMGRENNGYSNFCEALLEIIKTFDVSNQYALKILHESSQARNPESAHARIKKEIEAMSKNLHPNLIELVDADPDSKWYVSRYYPNGTLDKSNHFEGNLYKAVASFRPLVEAVAKLHENNYVHRDIKPHNVFINSNNELVLGDFGLVFFEDDSKIRVSQTFENVGSRDWMPPWAQGMRVENIKPTFDVFSLGKLLWSMVSGQPILQLWYYDRQKFNVEKLFPNSPHMALANRLFSKCIVEEENDCIPDAGKLLEEIDKIISIIKSDSDIIGLDIKRHCKVCGIGCYELSADDNIIEIGNFGFNPRGNRTMKVFSCSHCGHVQLFSYDRDRLPEAWKNSM